MALTTFTVTNLNSDPATAAAVDTGVGSPLGARASTFSPSGTAATTPAPTATADSGQGSQMANRAQVFLTPQTVMVSIDPGLGVNG